MLVPPAELVLLATLVPLAVLATLAALVAPVQLVMLVLVAAMATLVPLVVLATLAGTAPLANAPTAHQPVWLQVIKRFLSKPCMVRHVGFTASWSMRSDPTTISLLRVVLPYFIVLFGFFKKCSRF